MKKSILYIYSKKTTFIQRDIDILNLVYNVREYQFKFKSKFEVIFSHIKLLSFLSLRPKRFSIYIIKFAGHQSMLPSILGYLWKTPSLILVGGTDAAYFPKIKYGNYRLFFNRIATSLSYRFCTHISPCHESLIKQEYKYFEDGKPLQGFTVFYPISQSKPITTIENGYDYNKFQRKSNINRNENSFISIGNLSIPSTFLRKGYDLIFEMAKLFHDKQFTIIGTPKHFVPKISMPKNVKLLPYMNQAEILDHLSEHQFYLQLSIMEGFPNALCEAMLCECIPIGSDVSGIPDIIGENGFILEEHNKNKLYDIFSYALSLKNKAEYGINARNHIISNFPLERRKDELIKLVDYLIQKR